MCLQAALSLEVKTSCGGVLAFTNDGVPLKVSAGDIVVPAKTPSLLLRNATERGVVRHAVVGALSPHLSYVQTSMFTPCLAERRS